MIQLSAQILGYKELQKALEQLPKALSDKVVQKALLEVARPIADQAAANVSQDQGKLKKSIKALPARTRRQKAKARQGPMVFVGPTWPDGAAGHLVEFGTKAHTIKPKAGGYLKFEIGGNTIYVRSAEHPGSRRKPFLRPAWDINAGRLPTEIGERLWVVILKTARTLRKKAEKGTLGKRTRAQLASR